MKRRREFQLLKKYGWERLKELLKRENESTGGKRKFGKERDIDIVIDTLKFVDRLDDRNIVNYSLNKINNRELNELWESLRRNITQIGQKIASFYLRDLVDYNSENTCRRSKEVATYLTSNDERKPPLKDVLYGKTKIRIYGGLESIGGNRVVVESPSKKLMLDQGVNFTRLKKFYGISIQPDSVEELRALGVFTAQGSLSRS